MNNNFMNEIFDSINYFNNLSEHVLPILVDDVLNIVNSKCIDINEIEHCLDDIFNICYNDKAIVLFNKLCDYYDLINKEASDDYRQLLYDYYLKDNVKVKK